MRTSEPRFVNFPLVLLRETVVNPLAGMTRILDFGIANYAERCRRDADAALGQLLYVATRRRDEPLPGNVRRLLAREDIADLVESVDTEGWTGDGDFQANVRDLICEADPVFSPDESEALVQWLAFRDALHFLGYATANFDALSKCAAEVRHHVREHEETFGPLVWASLPVDFLNDVRRETDDRDTMRLFRLVAAIRSLVGKKQFTGTTKDTLRARMVGGKTPNVAKALISRDALLAAEFAALTSRKRFDRLLDLGATRGFYGKLGMGRRIYLSLTAKSPFALRALIVTRSARRAAYRQAEARARANVHPEEHLPGTGTNIEGGTFNKTPEQISSARLTYCATGSASEPVAPVRGEGQQASEKRERLKRLALQAEGVGTPTANQYADRYRKQLAELPS